MSPTGSMNGEEDNDEVVQRFHDLCQAVNMDKPTKEMAWRVYEETKNNYTLEGDSLQWLVCSLYAACRRNLPMIQTVGGAAMTSNCISLTKLLHEAKFSFISFLSKMDKWIEMHSSNDQLEDHVKDLGRNFQVCTNVFKKFMGVFKSVFLDPDDPKYLHSVPSSTSNPARPHRNRRHRKTTCSPKDIFKFCWTFFIHSKGTRFNELCNDTVGSFQLLLCVINLCYHNALACDHRSSLLNESFKGLPKNWDQPDFCPSSSQDSDIISFMVEKSGLGLSKEETEQFILKTRVVNIHSWKTFVQKLINDGILVGKEMEFLLPQHFQTNFNKITKQYEEYVLTEGDFDERVFLCDDVDTELGTPIKSPPPHMKVSLRNQEMADHLSMNQPSMPRTPLTNREYLERNTEAVTETTPVSSAVQTTMKLSKILRGKKDSPSESLISIFKECGENPTTQIKERIEKLACKLQEEYVKPVGEIPEAPRSIADARALTSKTLYYHVLEGIMVQEKKRLNGKSDLTELLKRDDFHFLLFACCVEIVLHCYQARRVFPWLLEALGVVPYYFYKVIELVIRAEENLPNLVIKHLNQIEEQILEQLAWKSESPLWEALEQDRGIAPQCEEVNHPHHIESLPTPGGSGAPSQSASLPHPRVKAVAQGELFGNKRSENGSAQDRFNSPAPGSAKRRLFTIMSDSNLQPGGVAQVGSSSPQTVKTIVLPASPGAKNITLVPVKKAVPDSVKPKKSGSLALFYRKVYHMASVRLKHLCENLVIPAELRNKIWTCFEHSIAKRVNELMRDRHIDQLLMCAVYVMAKITQHDQSFQEIMRCYRSQPQANSNVYRNVLIHRASSPLASLSVPNVGAMRSESAVSTPTPSSNPPSPATDRQQSPSAPGSQQREERDDLIQFYNKVYVPHMREFVKQFSGSSDASQLEVPISPMPLTRKSVYSPRKVATNIYVSPLRARPNMLANSGSSLEYNFQRSPAKQLREINSMMQRYGSPCNKRHLAFGESDDAEPETKRPVSRRLQLVHAQRNGFK